MLCFVVLKHFLYDQNIREIKYIERGGDDLRFLFFYSLPILARDSKWWSF